MKKLAILIAVVIVASALASPASAAAPRANPPAGLNEKVLEALKLNIDTRGWLYVPGTDINGLVMMDRPVTEKAEDGSETIKGGHFYNTHNFDKEEDANGMPYLDYRCQMRLGAMPRNAVIYGKSTTDDPNGEGFSQLKKYLDDDFAEEHPYIYYSDGRRTYTFLVFAVYTAHINMPYNTPTLSSDQMSTAEVLSTAQELSVREYEGQPSDSARILTLSTPVFSVDSTQTFQPPEYYRFVVMAKAVTAPTAINDSGNSSSNDSGNSSSNDSVGSSSNDSGGGANNSSSSRTDGSSNSSGGQPLLPLPEAYR